jgi:hypothetical protein
MGDEIATAGYYLGHRAIALRGTALQRFGPMFFRGHVSAITPFGLRWQNQTADYLIDVNCEKGMSGAPVCNVSGDVIGMLTELPGAGSFTDSRRGQPSKDRCQSRYS